MLKECEGCKRPSHEYRCNVIIEEDPRFRKMNCPCFNCLLKVVCTNICSVQEKYIWNRYYISLKRLYEIRKKNGLKSSEEENL